MFKGSFQPAQSVKRTKKLTNENTSENVPLILVGFATCLDTRTVTN